MTAAAAAADGDGGGVDDPMDALKARGLLVAVTVLRCAIRTPSPRVQVVPESAHGREAGSVGRASLQGGSAVGAIVAFLLF